MITHYKTGGELGSQLAIWPVGENVRPSPVAFTYKRCLSSLLLLYTRGHHGTAWDRTELRCLPLLLHGNEI